MNAQISVPNHRTTFCIAEQTKNLKSPGAHVEPFRQRAAACVPAAAPWRQGSSAHGWVCQRAGWDNLMRIVSQRLQDNRDL
jgi:hypothetical protein